MRYEGNRPKVRDWKIMIPILNKIYQGDAAEVMRKWPDVFVHSVVTSPPYWGLRDYGVKGQSGLEKTPEEYIEKMVSIFREVRRVLRKDGTLWLNIGDSYSAGGMGGQSKGSENFGGVADGYENAIGKAKKAPPGFKPKDLCGIPWMLAFALRKDGWYLRSDIIWAKPNPMPESVKDRPTRSHEFLFMLTKSAHYYYDWEAIAEPASLSEKTPDGWDTGPGAHGSFHKNGREKGKKSDKQRGHSRRHAGFNDRWDQMEREEQCSALRNKRDIWTVATEPFPEKHFATFPTALIKPCVLAGSPPRGIVLDPFMGAGTTALVACELNRDFIGTELNADYIKIAEKRISAEMAQGKMF